VEVVAEAVVVEAVVAADLVPGWPRCSLCWQWHSPWHGRPARDQSVIDIYPPFAHQETSPVVWAILGGHDVF
jgi:hypothetical protein